MIVEGKIWGSKVHTLHRRLFLHGEKTIVDTRTIKITGKLVEEINLEEDLIEKGENIRKIIFKTKSTILVWKYNSKLGSLYEVLKTE